MASAKLKQLQKKHGITGEYRGTSKGIVHAVKGGTEQKKTSAPPIHEEEYDGRVKGNKTKEQLISEHKRNTASSAVKNAIYREDYDVLKTDFTKKRDDALSGLNDISINPAKYGKAGAKLASVYQSDLDFYESKIKEVEKASRYAPGQGASKIMTEEEWNKRESPIEKRWSYQDYLDAQNYLAQPVMLTVNDNGIQKNLGNLSRGAYKAIEENKLDSYVIKTAEEGRTIAEYEKFVEKQIKKQQEEYAKQQEEWNRKNGGNKDSWFKSGGFSEGVDGVGDFFGDLGQTAAGTVGDLGLGVIKGVGRLAEGLIDLGTYGVAGVADLFGAEKFAEKTKDIAKYSATDEWTKGATDFVDKYSVLGNKADGVAEGIGQIAGIIGTAGIGAVAELGGAGTAALTTGTMGLSSMGTNIGEAYKSGATDGEAFVYGLGAGAIEAGTELLFGGLGKGVKALGISRGIGGLDDIFAKKLSSKIAGSFANESVQRALGNTVEFGVKSAGEGFEEVLSGVGSAVMKKLTYMTDEELTKLLKDENLLNQFIVGTVTSSIMQSPDYIKANKTGTDFVTGQTSEQERVIDAVAEYEVAKREESGEKLTNREKNKIYDDVTNVVSRASVDPLEQAAREVVARRNNAEAKSFDEVTAQSLERLTQNNAPITSEEVKKVTGFGDRGSELVAKTANVDGATFYEVMAEVKPSYTAGFNNPELDIKKVAHTFNSQAQEDAYTAGQKDAIMQNAVAKENAKSATVYDGKSNGIFDKTVGTRAKYATQEEVDTYIDDAYGHDIGNKTATNRKEMTSQESFDYFNSLHEDDNRIRTTTVNGITIRIDGRFGGGYFVNASFFNGDTITPWTVSQEFDTFEEAREHAAMLSFEAADYDGGLAPIDKYYGRNVSGVNSVDVEYNGIKHKVDSATETVESGENTSDDFSNVKSHAEDKHDSTDSKEPVETMYDFMSKRGLTYEEQSAILEYKSSESYKINVKLRKGIALTDSDKKLLSLINTALDKFEKFNGTVYRNIGFSTREEFDEFITKHSGINSIKYEGFTSASKSIDGYIVDTEYKVHYIIQSKNAVDVEAIGLTEEAEVLFKPNVNFIIKNMSVEGKTVNLELEEDYKNEIANTKHNGKNTQSDENRNIKTEHGTEHEGVSAGTPVVRGGGKSNYSVPKEYSDSEGTRSYRESGRNNAGDDKKAWNDSNAERKIIPTDIKAADDKTDTFQDRDSDELAMWTTKRVGGEVKPKSISEIVATIQHEYGINITTGHIRAMGVLGQYTKNNRGIRTKIANNLPVISHELGHYFERTLDIKSQLTEELEKELLSKLDKRTLENYPKEQLVREGVAEYVRRFLQNRETAAIDFPLFTDFFLKQFSGNDLARLEQLADDINAYYSLDADTATSSIRLREEGDIDLRTPMERLKDKGNSLYQAWNDSNHSIKRFDEATGGNAYKIASNAAYSDAMAAQILTGDLTDANGQYVSTGLKTALHGIDLNNKEEYRLFGEYLTVKHGPERLQEGMRIFADDRKNSTAWMQSRQAQLEEQYPQFKEASERLYKYIRNFYQTWGVNTGLISEEALKNWNERWEYYVPFNRVMEKGKGNGGAKRGFANQNSTIKKARGSGRDIYNPVDNLIYNIVRMVNAGVRNNVMLNITNAAEKLGADATFLEKVPMPTSVTKMDMTGVKDTLTNWLEESNLDTKSKEEASGIVNNLDDVLFQYGRGKANGNVVTVLKNGTPQAWKINDALLLQSLTNLSAKTTDGILDAYAVLSRFMTSNITGNNIVWSIFSNLPRDLMTFFTYSKNKNVYKMAKGVGSAYVNKIKGDKADPLYKEYLAMGGGQVNVYNADRDLTKKARKKLSDKNIDLNPLSLLDFVSNTVEAGPRFATYKMMREAGMSPQEAFYEAMDITLNFRRSGRIAREVNKVVPFFNAGVQSIDKFARWITAEEYKGAGRKKAATYRTISFVAASAAIAAIFYALNNSDDEKEKDYEQLSTYTKNSYWVIPLGDGKYFAISKPREIGVLSSFFERCMERHVGENEHAFDEFYAYASENFLPAIANDIAQIGSKGAVETGMNIIGSLGMAGAVAYLVANRDFMGRPIVSSGLQNLEPKDQYTDRTSKIAYWLGQAFNGSPEQIDFFFQQILGGWWKYQKALFPLGEKNVDYTLGVGNTYVKDNQFSTDLTNWLYDRADATTKSKNSNPDDISKAITAKWDSNMVDFYGTYYKKAKGDPKSTAARGTRQLVLDMIREYQKGIDGNYKTSWQEAVEKVCEDKDSTEYLPSVMSGEVTDGNDKKHALSDVQYVEYQTDYLRLYWEIVEETMSTKMTTAEKANILTSAERAAREKATERTLKRIGASVPKEIAKYSSIDQDDLTMFYAGKAEAGKDNSVKKSEVVNVISGLNITDDDAWTLYLSDYDSKGANYAHDNGIEGFSYIEFLEALNSVDEPTESGKYGTYTQEEAKRAALQLKGLSKQEKAILWQSVNTKWKNNPFR